LRRKKLQRSTKRPDEQAALETTFSCLINAQAGINLINDAGFLEGWMTGSLEMLLITDEVAGMTRMQGFPVAAQSPGPEQLSADRVRRILEKHERDVFGD